MTAIHKAMDTLIAELTAQWPEVAFNVTVQIKGNSIKAPTIPDIQMAIVRVADYFDVSPRLILSDKRHANLVFIRQAMWSVLHNLGYTFKDIGRNFNRDHSTIIHGVNRVHGLIDVYGGDRETYNTIHSLISTLKES